MEISRNFNNIETYKDIQFKVSAPGPSFTKSIYIPFIPDAMVVSQLSISDGRHITLISDLPTYQNNINLFTFSFLAPINFNYKNYFKLNGSPVNGVYTFRYFDMFGPNNYLHNMQFVIRFIKYKNI